MKVPRSTRPNPKRRYFIRMLFTALLTTTMIATGGFGVLSDNSVTYAFQDLIGENFPVDFLNRFNTYMANLSAPQIPPAPGSESDRESQPDPVGMILSFFGTESISTVSEPFFMDATITALAETQTQVSVIQSRTPTITTQTQTAIPSVTLTLPPTATQSPIPTWTFPPVYFPPTATEKIEPYPTFTFTNTPTNTPTPIPNRLVLYNSYGLPTGNLGPRSNVDAFCSSSLPSGFSNYHAFIGFSASDSIANMPINYGLPTNLPIQSDTNIVIANNWADLMDGNIGVSLSAAGVLSPGDIWWSGSESDGVQDAPIYTPDCQEWTDGVTFSGAYGNADNIDATWIHDSNLLCFNAASVLCIAY